MASCADGILWGRLLLWCETGVRSCEIVVLGLDGLVCCGLAW